MESINSDSSALRLAVVGCGAISEAAHIPAAAHVKQARLVALVDTDVLHAEQVASRYGVTRVAAGLEQLSGSIDAAILATPPAVRSSLAQRAFKQGLHVLCEKPMANSSIECQRMMSAAKDAQRVLAVGHNYRFFPNRVHARNLYKSGELGRMTRVTIEQGDPFGSSSRTLYTLRREMVAGGVLLNEGVHILDMLLWWFGDPQAFEYRDDSLGGLESNVDLTLNFADGGVARFRLSRTCSMANRVEMHFERGALSFPIYDMAALTVRKNGRVEQLTLHRTPWDFVEVAALQLQDFITAALDQKQPTVAGEDGLRTIRFIEACYERTTKRPRPQMTPLPGVPW